MYTVITVSYLSCRSDNSSQPIWSTNMYSLSTDTCFGTRNTCPLTSVSSCTHSNDVTVECSQLTLFIHLLYMWLSRREFQLYKTDCNYIDMSWSNKWVYCHGKLNIINVIGLIDLPAAVNGAIILYRHGISSNSYYYGVIRVYYNGWGNICDDSSYSSTEANVICHQLGYTGARYYYRSGQTRWH